MSRDVTPSPDPDLDQTVQDLAAGYPIASRQDWLALVDKTLKGGSLDRLTVRGAGGLETRALYTAEDAPSPLAETARFTVTQARGELDRWDVRTLVDHPNPAVANADALRDLENGASSLLLRIDPTGADGVAVASAEDLAVALAGVEIDLAPVALEAGWLGPQAGTWLHAFARSAPRARLALHLDPIGRFAETGASPGPLAAHLAQGGELAARLAPIYPDATMFLASGRVAFEAGGGEALELGLMAASVAAYVRAMQAAGLAAAEAMARIGLGLSADAEYFTTLAKHRAARAIWARMAAAYGCDLPARIESRAARRMLSARDPWVNLLRLTAAAFGAAVGGADAIVLEPFTQPLGRASAFARRQARNAQLVLMEESRLGRVADAAGGCWFLEDQTDQLARAGWGMLQQIERQGGAVAALQSGFVAGRVAEARRRRERDIASRKAGLVGVSVFPDLVEAGVEVLHVDPTPFAREAPEVRTPGADDACLPLVPWRAAQPFERLRAAADAAPHRPKVALATLGEDAAARVGFTQGLLAAGGVVGVVVRAEEYVPEDAPAAVLCGADADDAAAAAAAARALKAAGVARLYLAGRPGEAEAYLRAAGIDGFLYAGGDAVAALTDLLAQAGARP